MITCILQSLLELTSFLCANLRSCRLLCSPAPSSSTCFPISFSLGARRTTPNQTEVHERHGHQHHTMNQNNNSNNNSPTPCSPSPSPRPPLSPQHPDSLSPCKRGSIKLSKRSSGHIVQPSHIRSLTTPPCSPTGLSQSPKATAQTSTESDAKSEPILSITPTGNRREQVNFPLMLQLPSGDSLSVQTTPSPPTTPSSSTPFHHQASLAADGDVTPWNLKDDYVVPSLTRALALSSHLAASTVDDDVVKFRFAAAPEAEISVHRSRLLFAPGPFSTLVRKPFTQLNNGFVTLSQKDNPKVFRCIRQFLYGLPLDLVS